MATLESFKMALGKALKAIREREGLTQAELAERANVADETISRIERGAFEPALSTISQIAGALGTSVDALLNASATKQIRNAASPLVQRIAERAAELDTACQRALLAIAELLPTATTMKKRRERSGR